jgi:hypothetical protein
MSSGSDDSIEYGLSSGSDSHSVQEVTGKQLVVIQIRPNQIS